MVPTIQIPKIKIRSSQLTSPALRFNIKGMKLFEIGAPELTYMFSGKLNNILQFYSLIRKNFDFQSNLKSCKFWFRSFLMCFLRPLGLHFGCVESNKWCRRSSVQFMYSCTLNPSSRLRMGKYYTFVKYFTFAFIHDCNKRIIHIKRENVVFWQQKI